MSLKKTGILKKLDEIKLLPGKLYLVFLFGGTLSELRVKMISILIK